MYIQNTGFLMEKTCSEFCKNTKIGIFRLSQGLSEYNAKVNKTFKCKAVLAREVRKPCYTPLAALMIEKTVQCCKRIQKQEVATWLKRYNQ